MYKAAKFSIYQVKEPRTKVMSCALDFKDAGELLGVRVLDHVIIGYGSDGALAFYSMAEEGAL